MKKQLKWMLAAILICGTSVSAQAQEYKHEIAVSYGAGSNSDIISIYEDLINVTASTLLGSKTTRENESFFGPIGVEYFYHTSKMISLGGIFTYGHRGYDLKAENQNKGKLTNDYLTLMPAVKFTWLNSDIVGLYSKLALGATYRKEKDDDLNYSESKVHVNWQVSLIGFEAGSQNIRAFAELGTGEQGIILGGLRCKF